MSLIDLNNAIIYGKKKVTCVPKISNEDLILFKNTLAISALMTNVYNNTDDANSFFTVYPSVKQIIGTKKCVECFYACKLGYYIEGVPSKLVYIVNKIFKENDKRFVNKSLNTALPLLKPYVNCQFKGTNDDYTVKDIIENACGHSVKLLTPAELKVQVGTDWEVFIPNVERVALLSDELGSQFSYQDCERLEFKKDLGIVLGNIPIRTLNNKLGVVKDDFDLRECI
jgi:hypothetical protein